MEDSKIRPYVDIRGRNCFRRRVLATGNLYEIEYKFRKEEADKQFFRIHRFDPGKNGYDYLPVKVYEKDIIRGDSPQGDPTTYSELLHLARYLKNCSDKEFAEFVGEYEIKNKRRV